MILAIDTSIGTSVALVSDDGTLIAERSSEDTRGHAEAIGSFLAAVLRSSERSEGLSQADPSELPVSAGEITAVAVGMGPGPFTGLRVGIAAARAFALGRGVPVLPVLSHDAAAAAAEQGEGAVFWIVTDAKRREHYATGYAGVADGVPRRTADPALVSEIPEGAVVAPRVVRAGALGALALRLQALGLPTGPASPQYLREPDVTPSAGPKRVSG